MEQDKNKSILSNVAETIMEMPIGYEAGGQTFYMYPPSLGVGLLIERLMSEEVESSVNMSGLFNMLKALRNNKTIARKIAAICSFENRKDSLKADLRNQREKEISAVDDDKLMQLMLMFSAWNKDVQEFIEFFGLDKEQKYIQRCMDAKDKNDGCLTFNGKSVYGTLIDVACERYGWTFDYVVWGISINNLQMLMSDHITSVYLTKKEYAKANVPKDRRVIKMDSKNVDKATLLSLIK